MVKPLDSYVVCKIVTLRERGLSKKLKKSSALNLDRQLKEHISVFLRTNSYVAKKPPGRPEKLSKKEQKLMIRRVEKDPKTTLERVRVLQISFSTSKTRRTIRRILKKYGFVSRKAAKKFNLNKTQRLIRKRWCSRMLKKPLGFYPASIFHRKWEKFWIFLKKIFEKNLKLPEKPKRNKKFYQINHFHSELIAFLMVLPIIQDGNIESRR